MVGMRAIGIRATIIGWALGASVAVGGCGGESAAAGALRVQGSTTVNPIVVDAAELLRAEASIPILIDTLGGSSGGIAALGEGRADVAMSSRRLRDADRERFSDVAFTEHVIGADAVALVVSADVWRAGVRSLSRDEMRAIYEGRITNWSQVGGPDLAIAFFCKEPGRGTFEVFARWLYGDPDEAPAARAPEVGGNEEARNKVASTPGALSQLSFAWADGRSVFALALEEELGRVEPSARTIAAGSYALARPLYLLTDGTPTEEARRLIDCIRSERGQALVERHGYLGLARLEPRE